MAGMVVMGDKEDMEMEAYVETVVVMDPVGMAGTTIPTHLRAILRHRCHIINLRRTKGRLQYISTAIHHSPPLAEPLLNGISPINPVS